MNPILIDLPEQIESDRLLIRWPRPGTGAAVNEAIRESFDDLKRWMPWAQTLPSVEDSEAYARQSHAKMLTREDLALHLFRKDTGALVGCSGIHPRGWEVPKFEIGYWCRTSCQGQGFITEAVRAITAFGFATLKARRIEIRCDQGNARSSRVAERVGYRLEGTFPNAGVACDRSLRTTLVYALTA
jgi:RimJ/RimL family protein N-acetyltransferase